jgi:hypothetical protein
MAASGPRSKSSSSFANKLSKEETAQDSVHVDHHDAEHKTSNLLHLQYKYIYWSEQCELNCDDVFI